VVGDDRCHSRQLRLGYRCQRTGRAVPEGEPPAPGAPLRFTGVRWYVGDCAGRLGEGGTAARVRSAESACGS